MSEASSKTDSESDSQEGSGLAIASGLSTLPDPVDAASQAAGMLKEALNGSVDLVIGFITPPLPSGSG